MGWTWFVASSVAVIGIALCTRLLRRGICVEQKRQAAETARAACRRCAEPAHLWEEDCWWLDLEPVEGDPGEEGDADVAPRCPDCGAIAHAHPRRQLLDADRHEWPARRAFARRAPRPTARTR